MRFFIQKIFKNAGKFQLFYVNFVDVRFIKSYVQSAMYQNCQINKLITIYLYIYVTTHLQKN